MKETTNKLWVCALLPVTVAIFAGHAHAATGVLTGRLLFHNKNSGYCPASQDCTGSTYPESQYDSLVGIPEAKVQILMATNNLVIGSGVTDKLGNYTVGWFAPGPAVGTVVAAKIRVRYEHKDGRFRFLTTSGSIATNTSSVITLVSGNTQAQSWYWGTTSSPQPFANSYWAAWKLWDHRLKTSARMLNRFTNVDIYGFSDDAPCAGSECAQCATSCARGWFELMSPPPAWAQQRKTLVLSADAPYRPQERVMHEMGHMADYLARYWRKADNFNYGGNGGWSYEEAEYRNLALHEGFGSFLATSAFYHDYAPNPRTCLKSGHTSSPTHCYGSGGRGLETSSLGSCAALEGRWPVSSMRYFWDIYDEVDDGIDTIDLNLFDIFDAFGSYPCDDWPECFGAWEAHDAFGAMPSDLAYGASDIADPDIGSGWAFRYNMLNHYAGGYDVRDEYFNNCLGVF